MLEHTIILLSRRCAAGWRTTEPSNLKRHVLTHTGERPHHCTYCKYESAQSATLRNHLARKHPAMGAETAPVRMPIARPLYT